MRPAATHGSELYKVSGVLAIPYQQRKRGDEKGQSENRRHKPHGSFSEIYNVERGKDADDIDVQIVGGYTRTGASAKLTVHMHDYTNQKKQA